MDFVGKRRWFFLLSLIVILPGVVFLIIAPGLKPGIDFTGGSSLSLQFPDTVTQEEVRVELSALDHPDAIVQSLGEDTYFIRTKELDETKKKTIVDTLSFKLSTGFKELAVTDADGRISLAIPVDASKLWLTVRSGELAEERTGELRLEFGEAGEGIRVPPPLLPGPEDLILRLESEPVRGQEVSLIVTQGVNEVEGAQVTLNAATVLAFDRVSAVVARETARNAFYAVVVASVGIFFYVWWAFRNVPSPFRYGAAAIIALVHDSAVVIGIFAILGVLVDMEVNLMFMIALLTVIGYSVNDTIVVFDRLRENVLTYPNRSLADNVNLSISETLSRSMNTSLTLMFTLLALILFGGSTIREFLLVLLIGVVVGTYSSIAIASQALISWEYGDIRRLLRRGGRAT